MEQKKKNRIFYPLGTVGRDMVYNLFTNYTLLFILYTRQLTAAQLGAITAIMVAARIFDALNDPLMGNIIERTRGKYGKFKPWLVIGILATSVVIYLTFNTTLQGWNFIVFFGVIYFAYSITYTMHDISYWGMIPALSDDGNERNKITANASLFAGIGGLIASIGIPLLTTGDMAIGGNAATAYGRIALIIAVLAPLFLCFTLFGVRENRDDMDTPAAKVSLRKIGETIFKNDQLVWISVIFLIQEVGNGIVLGGIGSNYIYFEFGYEGGLYSIFSTIGMVATGILMIVYPAISKVFHRQQLVKYMCISGFIGYVIQLAGGLLLPATTFKFVVITAGYMITNLGQYGLYLVMMISIINTVEYNELTKGTRDEAIITSMRPFLTKLSSSITVIITTVTYLIANVTFFSNQISDYESKANQGLISAAEKSAQIAEVISSVGTTQKIGLLIAMTVIPCIFMVTSCLLYKKFYKLDEERFDEICAELKARKEANR